MTFLRPMVHRWPRVAAVVAMAAAALSAAGCGTPTHLAYVHNMNLGVDLGAAPTEGQVKLAIGYDRKTFALVPQLKADADAMSVTSASRVVVAGLSTDKFGHIVATGEIAKKLAKDPKNLGKLVDKLFGDENPPAKQDNKATTTPAAGGNP
jgi:hypothetical protein